MQRPDRLLCHHAGAQSREEVSADKFSADEEVEENRPGHSAEQAETKHAGNVSLNDRVEGQRGAVCLKFHGTAKECAKRAGARDRQQHEDGLVDHRASFQKSFLR
ncbi:hypothetical protein D9M73_259580 [compost metagenome]